MNTGHTGSRGWRNVLIFVLTFGCSLLALPTAFCAENAGEGGLLGHQSGDAFISLEDGAPGDPGDVELQVETAWETFSNGEPDPMGLAYELSYTGGGSTFSKNMTLSLTQEAELGNGSVAGNGDTEVGWQQRWVAQHGGVPSMATVLLMRLPTGDSSSGVDLTLVGVLAKDLGPGAGYLSAWATSANGHNVDPIRHFQWGAQLGYKWRLSDQLALLGNYVHKTSEEDGNDSVNLLELAAEYRVSDRLTVGPGILIGLDNGEETPNFGAGLSMTFAIR